MLTPKKLQASNLFRMGSALMVLGQTAAGSLIVRAVLAIILGFTAWQYFQTKVYDFPAASRFHGQQLYNPYSQRHPRWLKANFHAHSISWMGLTNGHQDASEVISYYQRLGYDIAGISDYERINPQIYKEDNIAIPAYEHGFNVGKIHQLVIGTNTVNYFDVMPWQSLSIRQFMINELGRESDIICLNHPGMRNGYPPESFTKLSGYDFIEALNGSKRYLGHWDTALSAGKAVWIMGNDDCHDIYRQNVGMSWNLISSPDEKYDHIMANMKNGNTIAVRRKTVIHDRDSLADWTMEHQSFPLKSVTVQDSSVFISLLHPVQEIRFIGDHGIIRSAEKNADSLAYALTPNDSYVRAEIETADHVFYLNPVFRYDASKGLRAESIPTVNVLSTLLIRLAVLLAYACVLFSLFPVFFKNLFYGNFPHTEAELQQTQA